MAEEKKEEEKKNNNNPTEQFHPIIKDLEGIVKTTLTESKLIVNELVALYNKHIPREYWNKKLSLEKAKEIASKLMEDLRRVILEDYLLKEGKTYNPNDFDPRKVDNLVRYYTGLNEDILIGRLLELPDLSFIDFYERIIQPAGEQIRRIGTQTVSDKLYSVWTDEQVKEAIGNYLRGMYEEIGVKNINIQKIISDREKTAQEILQSAMEKYNKERRARVLQDYHEKKEEKK